MFCIVAFVVGALAEQMHGYRCRLEAQNRELQNMNEEMRAINTELSAVNNQLTSSQNAFENANKKFNLLSTITRHDINNQLVALIGYLDVAKTMSSDATMQGFITKLESITTTIQKQITFTKDYEEIGIRAPPSGTMSGTILRPFMYPGLPRPL